LSNNAVTDQQGKCRRRGISQRTVRTDSDWTTPDLQSGAWSRLVAYMCGSPASLWRTTTSSSRKSRSRRRLKAKPIWRL